VGSVAYSSALDSLRRGDRQRFGGKSASLGELLAAGIPVPSGFALSTAAYEEFVDRAGLRDEIAAAMTGLEHGDVDAARAASESIVEAIRTAPVPDAVREQIAGRYRSIGDHAGTAAPPVAVRSSALGEDGDEATFAGQQDSYLWVRGAERVCGAVRDCWASLYTPEAISYRARLSAAAREGAAMGVTVQAMVDAEVSGVMFTCNPLTGDPSIVAVNASWGLGLAVVGGEVTPDDYLLSKVTGEIVRARVNDKHVQYVPAAGGHGAARVEVPPQLRSVGCLDDGALRSLLEMAKRVERHFGSRQDIEWALARGEQAPGNLYILQSRPVTAAAKREPKHAPESALEAVMSTFGANITKRP
jgi:pyruvate, water dikinase